MKEFISCLCAVLLSCITFTSYGHTFSFLSISYQINLFARF